MPTLSAFADEVTDDFRGQVEYLVREQVKGIELRFLDRKNILDLTAGEQKEVGRILRDHAIRVSAIGSPIGKVPINEPFAPHLDRFKKAVDMALFFETRLIRLFSYYPPVGGNIQDYRQEVIDRFCAKLEIIKNTALVLVQENEAQIYGHSAENCADLIQALGSPQLRLAYDPANFVLEYGIIDNIRSCWPLMKPYVAHVHIKDWKRGETTGCLPGQGDGQIEDLLRELNALHYDGWLTLEPHLRRGGQFGGSTGVELFSEALAAVRQLAEQTGLILR